MMRMMKMELVLFRRYLKQLALTTAFLAVCLSIGMGSTMGIPGIVFMLTMFTLTTVSNVYDDQNGWAAYRLSTPVSRRDVVLGRYAFVVAVSILYALVIAVLAISIGLASEFITLPEPISSIVRLDAERIGSGLLTLMLCGMIAVVSTSICMPVFFRFGATKATQWLPLIMMLLGVAPFLAIGLAGEGAMVPMRGALAYLETLSGMGAFGAVSLAISAACFVASCMVSVGIYRGRDL